MPRETAASGREILLINAPSVPVDIDASGMVRAVVHGDRRRIFACENGILFAGDRAPQWFTVVDASSLPRGGTRVSGRLREPAQDVVGVRPRGSIAYADVAADTGGLRRSPAAMTALLDARDHWDARYSSPEWRPRSEPSPSFSTWVRRNERGLRGSRVLVWGDGDGAESAALPVDCVVDVVELSPVGAQIARARTWGRSVTVECGDAYRWGLGVVPEWAFFASLYLPLTSGAEADVMAGIMRHARDAGGGYLVEFARYSLPLKIESYLSELVDQVPLVHSRGPDDIERIRFERPAEPLTQSGSHP